MAQLLMMPKFKPLDANGNVVAGGKVYTYAAGTSTPLATYTDASGSVPNSNPVILDASGEANIWLNQTLNYKIVFKDASDVSIWTVDNVATLQDLSVTTEKLVDGVLANTTAGREKMADGFLSATSDGLEKMADGFLQATTAGREKMADGFLSATADGRAKMASGFLLPTHKAALGQVVSSSCGSFSTTTTNGAGALVTNLSVTLTTTGRPVFLGLISAIPASNLFDGSYISLASPAGGAPSAYIALGSTVIRLSVYAQSETATISSMYSPYWTIETPAAGTNTFTCRARTDGSTLLMYEWKLVAFEL